MLGRYLTSKGEQLINKFGIIYTYCHTVLNVSMLCANSTLLRLIDGDF
jgi:hypothetical protein